MVATITPTPCSKRKYTLCFPVNTQNVAGAGPQAVWRDSQSEFPNNHATVCEEIPNGSKVLRGSLLGWCVRRFTKICFRHWLLCYWLIKCIPSNFDSELWNLLEFFHKLSFVGVELQWAIPHTLSWVLHDVGFEYLPTKTQSVYFLLELSVIVTVWPIQILALQIQFWLICNTLSNKTSYFDLFLHLYAIITSNDLQLCGT